MTEYEEKNAIITGVEFDMERGMSLWVTLSYGSGGQGFGGYLLYVERNWKTGSNFCGHFIKRLFDVAGVHKWADFKGKTVRVKASQGKVKAIGHIVKNDWFDPEEEFKGVDHASD